MEIDIDALPIPDWGLECPQCRYPLKNLPEHRCPECGARFEMRDVVTAWTRLRPPRFDGSELPLPDFGLLCGRCKAPLAGAEERSCPACREPFEVQNLPPRRNWFSVEAAMIQPLSVEHVEVLLADAYVPHVPVRDRTMSETILGRTTGGGHLLVPREFFFEFHWLLQQATSEVQRVKRLAEMEWTCPACGEASPGHFDLCWSCERPRA